MARFVVVCAAVFLLVCVCQADDTLLEKLRELLTDTKLEKRAFYNVLRNKEGIRVYFQTTNGCKRCAHTVRYWTDGIAQKLSTKPGVMDVDIPSTYLHQDVMIQVCEGSDDECRFAFLEKNEEGVRFTTLHENGL